MNRGNMYCLSLANVFHEASEKRIEMYANQERLNKKNRLLRSNKFYRDVCNHILSDNDDLDYEYDDMFQSTVTSKPWFKITCDILLQSCSIKY